MSSKTAKVKRYLDLPWENEYRIYKIPEDEGGGYCAYIPLLGEKRCRAGGDDVNEAISNLHRVLKDLIEDYVEKGWEIPEPGREPESFSGNFMVRTTSELHGRLVEKARKEGVSLNYLVGLLLERSLTERNVIDDLIGKSREARSHILKVLPGEKRKAAGSKK